MMDPVLKYARGVEFQGWGAVLLGLSAFLVLMWLLVLLVNPGSAGATWPFLVLAAAIALLGYVARRRGRYDEAEAHRENGPLVP